MDRASKKRNVPVVLSKRFSPPSCVPVQSVLADRSTKRGQRRYSSWQDFWSRACRQEFSRCTIQAIQTSAVSAKPDSALPVFAELRRGRPRHPLLLVVGGVALAVSGALAYGLA